MFLKISKQNHYYPYGLKHSNYNAIEYAYKENELGTYVVLDPTERSDYRYKYNGKEWQDELGLNVTAMDFRQYDNSIGRFVGMDRLSELVYSTTPNRFAFNNPVYYNDPTGLLEETNGHTGWVNAGNVIFWDPNVNNQDDVNKLYKDKGFTYVPDDTVVIDSDGDSRKLNGDGTVTTMLHEVIVKAPRNKESRGGDFGWLSIWGTDRSGDTSGWKGTTTHSLESGDFITPQSSRSLNNNKGIWEYILSLFKNSTDTYSQGKSIKESVKKNSNTSTMEVQNYYEPVIVTGSIKVVVYDFNLADSTVTQKLETATFTGEASSVKSQIDSVQKRNQTRVSNKDAWLDSWGK